MLILCEYCDIRCICYDDWMEHLLGSGHQEVISEAINSWDSSLNKRSLLVTINGKKPAKVDICWYFANYGLLCDVFFEADLEFCVIQLDKKDYVEAALLSKHRLDSAELSLRLKEDISDNEWLLLNSMVRRNATKDMVKKKVESFEDRHSKLTETLKSFPLDYQIERFEREIKINSVEIGVRNKLVKDMNRLFTNVMKYPKCTLCPYGSSVTGLGSNSSTFDLYFDAIGQSTSKDDLDEKVPYWRSAFEVVEKYLSNANRVDLFCYDFISLPRDATPSIKFIHYVTGVQCKITFDNLLPVQTTRLISFILKLDARLPALFLFVKYWAEYHKLIGAKLISTYSLYLLVLVYLTVQKILPSVSVLQSMSTSSVKVNGWETSFCEDISKITNLMSFFVSSNKCEKNDLTGKPTARSVLQLAAEFCKMYAHSDLQSLVVCSAIGELVPKKSFEAGNEDSLPKGLEAYKTWAEGRTQRMSTKTLLCIQDPFYLKRNVSSGTSEEVVWKFQFKCADTVDNIETVLKSPNPNLMEVFKPRQAAPDKGSVDAAAENMTNEETSNPLIADDRVIMGQSKSNTSLDSISEDESPARSLSHRIDYNANKNHNMQMQHQLGPVETPVDIYPIDLSVPPPNWNQYTNPAHQSPPGIPFPLPSQYGHAQQEFESETFHPPQYLDRYSKNPSSELEPILSPPLFPEEFPPVNTEPPLVCQPEFVNPPMATISTFRTSSSRTLIPLSRTSQSIPPTITIRDTPAAIDLHFGKYEHVITYPPSNDFARMFQEHFGNLVIESALKIRLKVLWCFFLRDFFSRIWSESFLFEVEEINPGSISLNSNKTIKVENGISGTSVLRSLDAPPDAKRQKKDYDETACKYTYTPQNNPYKQKFFELQVNFRLNIAFLGKVKANFLYGRNKIRRRATSDSHLVKRCPNPLDLEKEVSRRVLVANLESKTHVAGQFAIKILFDVADDNCATAIVKCIQGNEKDTDAIEDVADHIICVFRDTVPKYQMFRLTKWLDKTSR